MENKTRLARSTRLLALVTLAAGLITRAPSAQVTAPPDYTVAYASFAPLNTEIFIADADGANAAPFLPSSGLDYNSSFSAEGQWVIFTSDRGGSTDIYRARLDGSALTRLTDDPAFDDQGHSRRMDAITRSAPRAAATPTSGFSICERGRSAT